MPTASFIKYQLRKICHTLSGSAEINAAESSNPFASHPELVLNYAIQIAKGLDAAHNKGVIHRDIKPANIMVSTAHEVKILDFGLAKIAGVDQLTKVGSTLGTINYMSPEQIRGEELGPESDIWSFGIVLYEMMSGNNPFGGDYEHSVMYSILNTDPAPVQSYSGEVPEGLNEVIDVDANDVMTLQEKSVESLLSMLNLELNPETIGIIREGKTSVPAAFELYIQRLGYLQRYERLDNINNAIFAFEEANRT